MLASVDDAEGKPDGHMRRRLLHAESHAHRWPSGVEAGKPQGPQSNLPPVGWAPALLHSNVDDCGGRGGGGGGMAEFSTACSIRARISLSNRDVGLAEDDNCRELLGQRTAPAAPPAMEPLFELLRGAKFVGLTAAIQLSRL